MKLNELISLAIERFEKEVAEDKSMGGVLHMHGWIKKFLKTELTNIVKESFKNTRVEEITSTPQGRDERDAYNEALKNIKDTQNQFLNN